MATPAKKTNYIAYELAKLDKYLSQLEKYLDDNPPDEADDRLDVRVSTQGNPIVRVISSKENQVKAFRDIFEKLPKLIEDVNRLRKLADTGEGDVSDHVRGGRELPGLFKNRMLTQGKDESPEKDTEIINIIEDEKEDDDEIWEDDD